MKKKVKNNLAEGRYEIEKELVSQCIKDLTTDSEILVKMTFSKQELALMRDSLKETMRCYHGKNVKNACMSIISKLSKKIENYEDE